MASGRFAPRPVAQLLDQLCDALAWPTSRPPRLLAGDRATLAAQAVLCVDEGALAALERTDVVAILMTPATAGGARTGRRVFDPFVGDADDVAAWRRADRVVLDAALPIAGGRGGLDERLAELVPLQPHPGLRSVAPLRSVSFDIAKLVGYVPIDAIDHVRDAVFAAGAGTIGDYDRCSWSTRGTGTFRAGEDTNPTVGTPGSFEQVEEVRIEVVVPRGIVDRTCRAFTAAHPYEEPAFDIVQLATPASVGFGRLGLLGDGGGSAAWSAMSAIDPDLTAHRGVDQVAAGAACAVHAGPVRDVLDAVLAEDELALLVAAEASDAELELLAARGIALLLVDRARLAEQAATDLAGLLSRTLGVPVGVQRSLHFPEPVEGAEPVPSNVFGIEQSTPTLTGLAAEPASGTWRLHFDGGSRGNPGPAAYGWVLYDPDGNEFAADGVKVGSTTNNVAEWTGLLRGLEHAADLGVRTLEVRGDSELVVKQVTGVYRVKNAALKPIAEQVATVLRRFERTDVRHVYRDDNARADELANEALDGVR